MSILKYTMKYLAFSLLVLIVIVGIGSWIHGHRQKRTAPVVEVDQASALPSTSRDPLSVSDAGVTIPSPKINRGGANPRSRLGSEILPHRALLPPSILARLNQERRKMIAAGTRYEVVGGENVITVEAYEREYAVLVGDMSASDAVAFLETHGLYNPVILDKLEPRRAIDYLYKVGAHQKDREAYARSVLARDPVNTDAQLLLLSTEPDNTSAVAGYKAIVNREPENNRALSALGYRLHYDHPEEAIPYLKRANTYFGLGLAHERLGDLKTAWLYYRKQQMLRNSGLIEHRKRAIEMGKPLYEPISGASDVPPVHDEVSIERMEEPHDEPQASVSEAPPMGGPESFSEGRPSSEDRLTDADRREAARAAAERAHAAEQQEFDKFMKWAENTMNVEESLDFLSIEMAAHLKGRRSTVSPERIIRAYELIERSGFKEGIHLIRANDPELAEQIERWTEKRQNPDRNNSQRK